MVHVIMLMLMRVVKSNIWILLHALLRRQVVTMGWNVVVCMMPIALDRDRVGSTFLLWSNAGLLVGIVVAFGVHATGLLTLGSSRYLLKTVLLRKDSATSSKGMEARKVMSRADIASVWQDAQRDSTVARARNFNPTNSKT